MTKRKVDLIKASWKLTEDTFLKFDSESNFEVMSKIAEAIAVAFKDGNKVLIAGNGGSSCDAMHFAEEFTGRFRKDRRPLPVIHCMDASHITCVGNDYGFSEVFSRTIEAFSVPGDIFIAISTSGNSENIIKAVSVAKQKGVAVVSLLGKDGGKLKGSGDYEIVVPGTYADKIQEVHMAILHIIIEVVESIMFGANT